MKVLQFPTNPYPIKEQVNMQFEAAVLSAPLALTTDPEGEAIVTVRQATEGENIERNELFAKTRRIYNDGNSEVTLEQDYNIRKLRRKEAYLTLATATGFVFQGDELFSTKDEGDGYRVRAAMKEGVFNAAWNRLPGPMVEEIVAHIYTINPEWNPNGGN